jgi:hypothetical protein
LVTGVQTSVTGFESKSTLRGGAEAGVGTGVGTGVGAGVETGWREMGASSTSVTTLLRTLRDHARALGG